jgi:hypothetical protein
MPGIDLEKALLDPGAEFASPSDVLAQAGLARDQKVEILRRWEYDARELAVAEDEGMPGAEPSLLARIRRALAALAAEGDVGRGAPTQHGGPAS